MINLKYKEEANIENSPCKGDNVHSRGLPTKSTAIVNG
jgi:hypothetical protein